MMFFVIVKIRLTKPFDFWKQRFDAESSARRASGVFDQFAYPVIGEQAAVFAVKTATPRLIHDMTYNDAVRPGIEASGFAIGEEVLTVCESID
jgi:hypothetical protein